MKIDADKLLNELEQEKRKDFFMFKLFKSIYHKACVKTVDKIIEIVNGLVKEEEKKAENQTNYKIDLNMFDEETTYTNCTVQVLHNSITDEYSVGWWNNEKGVQK